MSYESANGTMSARCAGARWWWKAKREKRQVRGAASAWWLRGARGAKGKGQGGVGRARAGGGGGMCA